MVPKVGSALIVCLLAVSQCAYALDPWPVAQYRFVAGIDVPTATGVFGATGLTDVNEMGTVLGSANDGATESPFLQQGMGYLQYLPLQVPGETTLATIANGLNRKGQVVGGVFTTTATQSFFYDPRDRATPYTLLAPPTALSSQATALNDASKVVGYFYTPDGLLHGFLWNGRRFLTVDAPVEGVIETVPLTITNSDDLGGYYRLGDGSIHGFLWLDGAAQQGHWAGGTFSEFLAPGSIFTLPYDRNDQGDTVGLASMQVDGTQSVLLHEGQWSAILAPGTHISFTEVSGVGNRHAGQVLPPVVGRLFIRQPVEDPSVPPYTQGFVAYPLPQDAPEAVAQVRGVGQRRQAMVAMETALVVEPVLQRGMRLDPNACTDTSTTVAIGKLRGRKHCR